MPRPPKNKAIEPAPPARVLAAPPPARHIDVDNFIRVRDSVYARLATIQDLIKSFAVDYLRQTNLLLGEGTNVEDGGQLLAVETAINGLVPQPAAPAPPAEGDKKERKKRTHDPNAPKRPLTPYFLYMQTARPIIASDLGETAAKGAVQAEGQRRWGVMGPAEKQGWNQAYEYNLRLYKARVHSYKAGNLDAKNMPDEVALAYANEHNIDTRDDLPVEDVINNEQEAIAEQLGQSAVAEAEEEEPAAPAAKTPKKANNTRKRKTATPAAEPEPKAAATPASPAQKRKRTSTKAELTEEPKKSARKKTKSG